MQAFYTINWFHDRMLGLGFDEASGNFQQVNLQGQGGLGGDRVAADVQNTGANNASFSTPAKLGAMTVHAWSLLIKPRNFTCQIFIPSDPLRRRIRGGLALIERISVAPAKTPVESLMSEAY